jgi:trigger factor
MKVVTKNTSDTVAVMTITAVADDLQKYKALVTARLSKDVKVPGFRTGKVPTALVEKHLDANRLQGEVLEETINHLYLGAINESKVRVVSQPKITVTKYVPYADLVFTAEVDIIGKVKLPDYKNISVKKAEIKITDENIKEVLERIRNQAAIYTEVDSPAKDGNRATIDFAGQDDKSQPIPNATGKDYPLVLGSKSFIAGFEEEVVGLKKGDTKTFTLTFPKDYYVKLLAGKKVTFSIELKKVEEVKLEELNDAFAAKVGPFKTIGGLKADIRKQLNIERGYQAERAFEEQVIKTISDKATISLPDGLLEEQMKLLDEEFRQNLSRRGQTFEDYLANNVITEDEYRAKELKPMAKERLKGGLVLAEIAAAEGITVTPEELKIRIQALKSQFKDEKMQAELDKPENQRDITSRMITEKTIAKLVGYVNKQ